MSRAWTRAIVGLSGLLLLIGGIAELLGVGVAAIVLGFICLGSAITDKRDEQAGR